MLFVKGGDTFGMKFVILDHIREAGSADNTKPNDDWIGHDDRVAVVADGATGLSDERLVNEMDSDAQWIARTGVEHFLSGRADDPVRELVREINDHALMHVSNGSGTVSAPRYAWPTASFIMARLQSELLEISGLGDCVAYVEMSDGFIERFSAMPHNREIERNSAKADIGTGDGNQEIIRSASVLEKLRVKRNLSNTPRSGVWTLGLVPEAADQVFTAALPLSDIKNVLLMSDGFSAAVESYDLYDPGGFIAAIKSKGMGDVMAEIRRIERLVDPSAIQYPRYKQSDDSSAILFEIGK